MAQGACDLLSGTSHLFAPLSDTYHRSRPARYWSLHTTNYEYTRHALRPLSLLLQHGEQCIEESQKLARGCNRNDRAQ
eukprot:12916017-Alexandrium_andersonii.AAC.1